MALLIVLWKMRIIGIEHIIVSPQKYIGIFQSHVCTTSCLQVWFMKHPFEIHISRTDQHRVNNTSYLFYHCIPYPNTKVHFYECDCVYTLFHSTFAICGKALHVGIKQDPFTKRQINDCLRFKVVEFMNNAIGLQSHVSASVLTQLIVLTWQKSRILSTFTLIYKDGLTLYCKQK